MATNKMLIDASHPEETRVAVVRGNRIEEFDFESLEKQQLRGNIYLAKVTRVEPSLQAAFVDYGGNRHGFLAFSEIHPDYYQIPVADRQALLEEEAAVARASREADELEDEKPKARKSRKTRKSKKASGEDAAASTEDSAAELEAAEAPADPDAADAAEAVAETDAPEPTESTEAPAKKTRRPRRRTKKADEKPDTETAQAGSDGEPDAEAETQPSAAEAADTPAEAQVAEASQDLSSDGSPADETEPLTDGAEPESGDQGDPQDPDDQPPKSMAAMVEMDTISEPASDGDEEGEDSAEVQDEAAEEAPKPAPKKRRRTTKSKAKATEPDAKSEAPEADDDAAPSVEATASDQDQSADEGDGAPKEPSEDDNREAASAEAGEGAVEGAKDPDAAEADAASDDETDAALEAKTEADAGGAKEPKARRKRSTRRKREEKEEVEDGEAAADAPASDEDDDDVESVGQEDALEEVPERFKSRRQYKIQEVIKRRQVLLVQVVKEERGNKGAALTTYLSLAGRYSVLMPNTARGGGISRKITNANDRKRLKAIANELEVPEGMGVILRTAGASRTKAEINRDFEYLLRLWEKVRNLTLSSSAPCLVYEEGSLIKRSIRDLYNKDIGEILVSGEAGYQEASDFMGMLMPKHVNNVKLYEEPATIFTRYGVEAQLERMVTPQVTLKSGGYLVMNQTEALVAIDVNSGRSTREHSIEDTALQTNLEAAEEVARQLRLRDLAGLIVIDFIDMEEKRNNRAVEKRLKDCLKNDRARIQVGRISHFGLLEMSRQRIRASVLESTMDACPHCQGMGYVRSDSAIALHVFRAIEEHLNKHNRFNITVKTSASIALYILNHKRMALLDLESRFGLKIMIEGDLNVVGQEFEIERGEPARGKPDGGPKAAYNGGSGDSESGAFADQDGGDEEPGEKKRRRKRRRGKRRDADGDSTDETGSAIAASDDGQAAESDAGETGSVEAEASESAEGRSRSRRGKRGGRRKKALMNEDGQPESQPPETADIVDSDGADEPAMEAAQPGEPESTEPTEMETQSSTRRPRRSTRRPRKESPPEAQADAKSDSDEAEVQTSPDEPEQTTAVAETDNGAQEQAPEPPKRPRRSTKRPKKDASDAPDSALAEQVPSEPAGETDDPTPDLAGAEEIIASSDEPTEDTAQKKRGGWWSRGGGFFG